MAAFNVRISDETIQATAFNAMIEWSTFGIQTARVDQTWIDAATVQTIAQFCWRTVFVVLANRLVIDDCKQNEFHFSLLHLPFECVNRDKPG